MPRAKTNRGRPLSYREKITAVYYAEVEGIAQHTVAGMLQVNPQRVNEAIAAVRAALQGIAQKGT